MEHKITNLTTFLKKSEIKRDFYIIDAVDILVRLMEMTGKALQPREHDENLHHNPCL